MINMEGLMDVRSLNKQGYSVRRITKLTGLHRNTVKKYLADGTLPGQQAQVDFGNFQITNGDGTITTVYCFIMVLGYSRHMYVEFIDRCTMSHFLNCHQNAFGFFGGIPEAILALVHFSGYCRSQPRHTPVAAFNRLPAHSRHHRPEGRRPI